MLAVAAYVRSHPGCSKCDVARAVCVDNRSIDRAIAAGLIRADRPGRYRYKLYPATLSPDVAARTR